MYAGQSIVVDVQSRTNGKTHTWDSPVFTKGNVPYATGATWDVLEDRPPPTTIVGWRATVLFEEKRLDPEAESWMPESSVGMDHEGLSQSVVPGHKWEAPSSWRLMPPKKDLASIW